MDRLQIRLERNFIGDGNTIPTFIDSRDITHRNCFLLSQSVHKSLLILFQEHILSKTIIEDTFLEVAELIEEIIDLDSRVALDYLIYFKDVLNYYKEKSIEYELYETTQNIDSFLEIYEKIKT
jgi:nucleoside-diphosphate-sugar epimerase